VPAPFQILRSRLALAVLLLLGACAPERVVVDASLRPADQEVASGETFVLPGPSGEYPIHVVLPPGYDAERPEAYPTLYFADAWWLTELVTGVARIAVETENADPFVLVGIGTKGNADQWNLQRNIDLTPSPFFPPPGITFRAGSVAMDSSNTGGAASFAHFLRQSVLRRVEAVYHVDSSRRAWLGHSFGGLFGAWVRRVEPDLFQDFLLISPSAFWNDGETIRASHQRGGRVFLSYGTSEHGPITRSVPALAEALELADVRVRLVAYEGRDHHSVLMPALWDGILEIYGR
jgi:predicted alpha/beta superfamily hydrolase